MKMAGLLENPSRGLVRVSPLGLQQLAKNLARIDIKFLRQFPGYLEFVGKPHDAGNENGAAMEVQGVTPKEQIDAAYKALRSALAKELLERVRASSPQFFEEIVVR